VPNRGKRFPCAKILFVHISRRLPGRKSPRKGGGKRPKNDSVPGPQAGKVNLLEKENYRRNNRDEPEKTGPKGDSPWTKEGSRCRRPRRRGGIAKEGSDKNSQPPRRGGDTTEGTSEPLPQARAPHAQGGANVCTTSQVWKSPKKRGSIHPGQAMPERRLPPAGIKNPPRKQKRDDFPR